MLKNLKDFANAIFDAIDWPDGFALDGADFQEIAVKYGLLVPETRYEPCGEHCNCLEYYTKSEMALGVTCYRKAEWLNADVDPRLLTTDAPEMTVGDSGSVSKHSIELCPDCLGTGRGGAIGLPHKCTRCNGTGRVFTAKKAES